MYLLRSAVTWLLVSTLLHAQVVAQIDQVMQWGKDRARKKAESEITRKIGESVGLGAPIILNQRSAFPQVDEVGNFHPTMLELTSVRDLAKPLPPGDYSLKVIGFCMRASIHAPGKGLPYKLAPLEGKQAEAIGTLFVRGMLAHVPVWDIWLAGYEIQAGTPLSQMRPEDQVLIHHLIPQYEGGLQGDFLENINTNYNKYRLLPNMPSLDTMLSRSEPGKEVLRIRRTRQILADQTTSAENAPDRLYEPQGDGLPRVLPPSDSPQPSPWAEIRPGVFARFTVDGGNLAENLFEFRITEKAIRSKSSSGHFPNTVRYSGFFKSGWVAAPAAGALAPGLSVADVFGIVSEGAGAAALGEAAAVLGGALVLVGAGILIGYAIGQGAQALAYVPKMFGPATRAQPMARDIPWVDVMPPPEEEDPCEDWPDNVNLPDKLYTYTSKANAARIMKGALGKWAKPEVWLTLSGGLTPWQAYVDLNIDPANTEAVIEVDSSCLDKQHISECRRVQGGIEPGRSAGGGIEILYKGVISRKCLKQIH